MLPGQALAALATLLAAAVTAPGPDPGTLAGEVLALAASGDPGRLARARAAVPPELRADPAFRGAVAARAMAGLLLAADLRERSAAAPDGEAGLRDARALKEEALDELRSLLRDAPDDPDVLRALALYYGTEGRPGEEARVAEAARVAGAAPDDPWLALAGLAVALRGLPAAEAEPALGAFVAAHRSILPPRMSLVRARLALGDADGAVAALDALLAIDADHEAARELKAALLAPPPPLPLVPTVPAGPPPATAPGWLPRKRAPRAR